MSQLFDVLKRKSIVLPEDALQVLSQCRSFEVFDTDDLHARGCKRRWQE
jgi:hypothetical protein